MRSTHSAAPRLPGCHTLHKPWQRFTTKVEHVIILVKPKGSKSYRRQRPCHPLFDSRLLRGQLGLLLQPKSPTLLLYHAHSLAMVVFFFCQLVCQRFGFGFKISRTLKDPLLTFLLFSSVLWRVSRQNGHCHWFPPPWRATGGSSTQFLEKLPPPVHRHL